MEELTRKLENAVQQSIATHRLEDAFNQISGFITDFDELLKSFQNDLILVQSRYHEFRLNTIKGLLKQDDITVESARISNNVLGLLNLIISDVKNDYDTFYKYKLINHNRQRLLYDSSTPTFFQGTVSIMKFNTAKKLFNIRFLMQEDHLTWSLTADNSEFVGLNFLLSILRGKVTFQYMIKKSLLDAQNISFLMIPMKSNYDLIEVGSELREAEYNAFSKHRIRKDAVLQKGIWQSEEITFDFSKLKEAKECIFGPRINEGCTSLGSAIFSIRKIKIYRD